MKTKTIGFRATPAQVAKLEQLATGEGLTISQVCGRLVDLAPVKRVSGLKIALDAQQAIISEPAPVGEVE